MIDIPRNLNRKAALVTANVLSVLALSSCMSDESKGTDTGISMDCLYDGTSRHTIVAGESLSSVIIEAVKYPLMSPRFIDEQIKVEDEEALDMYINDIAEHNNIEDSSLVYPGQIVELPTWCAIDYPK